MVTLPFSSTSMFSILKVDQLFHPFSVLNAVLWSPAQNFKSAVLSFAPSMLTVAVYVPAESPVTFCDITNSASLSDQILIYPVVLFVMPVSAPFFTLGEYSLPPSVNVQPDASVSKSPLVTRLLLSSAFTVSVLSSSCSTFTESTVLLSAARIFVVPAPVTINVAASAAASIRFTIPLFIVFLPLHPVCATMLLLCPENISSFPRFIRIFHSFCCATVCSYCYYIFHISFPQ